MLGLVLLLFGSFRAALHSRADLVIENLALRQQLAVLAHTGRRGRVTGADRLFWVTLRRLWTRWSEMLVFVKPETVVRWHRAGFRRYWTWLSRGPAWSAANRRESPRAGPTDGDGERWLGRAEDSRRAPHARLRCVQISQSLAMMEAM